MKKSTLTQVTLNRRVTFDGRIEFFSFFLKKKWRKNKKTVCKWANWVWKPWFWLVHRCFNFLKSVKKFLPRTQSLTFPIIQSFCPGSQIDLYFWNRLPDYFANAREPYNSLACQNLCTVTLLLFCQILRQLAGYITGSRGDVFVVKTSKPVENLWKNGLFWSRYSYVTHSIDCKPRD